VPADGAFVGTNHLDIAVSKTSDPTGQWAIYSVPVQDDGTDGTPDHGCEGGPCLGDYPQIGADAFGFYFYITTNEYPFFADGFHAAQVYAFNKFALARNAATVNVTQVDTIGTVNGNPGFTLRPAVIPGIRYELAQGGTEYFLSSMAAEEANGSGTDNRIAIWSLTRTATLLTSTPQPVLRNSTSGSAPTASRPRPTRSLVTSHSANASTTPPWRPRSGRAAGSCCSSRNPPTTRSSRTWTPATPACTR
jgi:hypothetical protein